MSALSSFGHFFSTLFTKLFFFLKFEDVERDFVVVEEDVFESLTIVSEASIFVLCANTYEDLFYNEAGSQLLHKAGSLGLADLLNFSAPNPQARRIKSLRVGEALDREKIVVEHQTYSSTFSVSARRCRFYGKPSILVYLRDISKLETKERFLTACSHELRTPLSGVLGMLELAKSNHSVQNDSDLGNLLHVAFLSGHYLLHLVNDILDMSKIEVGRFSFNEKMFDLPDLFHCVAELVSIPASQRQVTLYGRFSSKLTQRVVSDATRLTQILLNILSNAIKYTPVGGDVCMQVDFIDSENAAPTSPNSPPSAYLSDSNGQEDPEAIYTEEVYCQEGVASLSAASSSTFVKFSSLSASSASDRPPADARTKRGMLKVSVKDSGAGIEKEDLKKLFRMFGKLTDENSMNPSGCGVGLMLSKEMCEQMGGEIGVTSEGKGKGTTFWFKVPIMKVEDDGQVQRTFIERDFSKFSQSQADNINHNSSPSSSSSASSASSSTASSTAPSEAPSEVSSDAASASSSSRPGPLLRLNTRSTSASPASPSSRALFSAPLSTIGKSKHSSNLSREFSASSSPVTPDSESCTPMSARNVVSFFKVPCSVPQSPSSCSPNSLPFESPHPPDQSNRNVFRRRSSIATPSNSDALNGERTNLTRRQSLVPTVRENMSTTTACDRSSRHCVVVAEDNDFNMLVLSKMLQDSPFQLIQCRNGKEAVDFFHSHSPDELEQKKVIAILMDVNMPVMDGLEAARRIRQMEKQRGVRRMPIVGMSASSEPSEVQKGLDAGFDENLGKPFAKSDLLQRLDSFVH